MLQRILGMSEAPLHRRIDSRSLSLEAIAVVVIGALGSAGYAYFAFQMYNSVANPAPYTEINLVGTVVTPILVVVLFWIWYTVSAHFIAKRFGARRPINRMFRATAWSLIPIGVWNLIRSLVIVGLFATVDFPAEPEGTEAEVEIQSVLELGLESPVYVATLLLGVAFVAWSWRLLATGISEATEISLDDAKKVAVVPAGTYALYLVWHALQWQGLL